jgi:hypothetical protein
MATCKGQKRANHQTENKKQKTEKRGMQPMLAASPFCFEF